MVSISDALARLTRQEPRLAAGVQLVFTPPWDVPGAQIPMWGITRLTIRGAHALRAQSLLRIMTSLKEPTRENRIEDTEKDLYSIQSGSTYAAAPVGIDAEVAQFFAAQVHDPVVIDEATNTRLRWIAHKCVLTLDKGTLSFASIMGIISDTHLVGQDYAWLTTCVYIAILLWEFPTS
ncbi:hypothetical protein DFH07DRAFT_40260 [Mycena maculata]|uniref:Uncharacterized protein n=1 Tax=Mycena maculata TaxID=230809 RepID=A0AAD7IG88_9AGAR|nr:hypothetical protein DFH07DRAFT_40260 [Mycena maculata]